MELQNGTWIAIDQNPTLSAPYAFCVSVGCVADYKANDQLLGLLHGGRDLVIRSVDTEGQVVSFALPLLDFGRVYSGPPIQP
jgi:invasion protein IalB